MAGAYGPVASRGMVVAAGIRIACALLALVLLAGCGNDDRDRQNIARTLRTTLTTTDPAVLCGETLSSGLIARVYGGDQRCNAVERGSAGTRRPPAAVEVSGIKIDGDRASASVAVRGGDQDGVRGALTVVRQDGGWRLDDLSTAFLRSSFDAGLKSGGDLEGALVACLGKKVVTLDDAALRALAFGAMGGRPEAQQQLRGLVGECVAAFGAPAGGQSA